MSEWREGAEIVGIEIGDLGEGHERVSVGDAGVTRIEGIMKSGMHSGIPYLRVWCGEYLQAEYCQHNVIAVIFD